MGYYDLLEKNKSIIEICIVLSLTGAAKEEVVITETLPLIMLNQQLFMKAYKKGEAYGTLA